MEPDSTHADGLSRKQRMLRALRREPVDRIPTQSNYTRLMGRLLSEHFGIAEAQLPERLGNHLLRVDLDCPRRTNADGSIEFDWWGAGWDTRTEGYWHAFSPLKDSLDLDRYAWPDRMGHSGGDVEDVAGRCRELVHCLEHRSDILGIDP